MQKKKLYQVNGNFYFASPSFLKKYKSFYYKDKTCAVILKSNKLSLDIDTKKILLKQRIIYKIMKNKTISIIGLGFVGLPLACILATKFNNKCKIIGIDKKIKNSKINKKNFFCHLKKLS